jgi:hypothetical protein
MYTAFLHTIVSAKHVIRRAFMMMACYGICLSTGVAQQSYQNYTGRITMHGASGSTHFYTAQFATHGDTMRRTTTYFDNAKKPVRVEMTDFRLKPLALITNKIDDYRTGEYLLQTVAGSRFTTVRRERKGGEMQTKFVQAENSNTIVATLISERLRQGVETLERGQNLTFTLALPTMGIVTDMKVEKVADETISGVPCVTVKMEPSNFLFKAMQSEPSYFSFERAAPHRFMRYKGILGLPTDEGKQQSGVVMMVY